MEGGEVHSILVSIESIRYRCPYNRCWHITSTSTPDPTASPSKVYPNAPVRGGGDDEQSSSKDVNVRDAGLTKKSPILTLWGSSWKKRGERLLSIKRRSVRCSVLRRSTSKHMLSPTNGVRLPTWWPRRSCPWVPERVRKDEMHSVHNGQTSKCKDNTCRWWEEWRRDK